MKANEEIEMVKLKTEEQEVFRICGTPIFAIIHISLILTSIIFFWLLISNEINDWHFVFKSSMIFISGIAGFGIYLCLIPTLSRVERAYYNSRK